MKNLLASIGLVILGVLIRAIIILPFSVYVIMDIARLFNVERVLIIPKEALFGLMIIISIVSHRNRKSKTEGEKDNSTRAIEMITSFFETFLVVLIGWSIAYVVHKINF
jgi:hypothetical protein